MNPPPPHLAELSVDQNASLLEVMRLMDQRERKALLVLEGEHFRSLVSIGDIQRAIIRQVPLETPVKEILRSRVRVSHADEPFAVIRRRMLEHRAEVMPVIDAEGRLVRVHEWTEVFAEAGPEHASLKDVPVVIMAGGEGRRLRPITHVIPKALIPVGKQPIIEEIMDRFHLAGVGEFHVSVRYKAEMIQQYLNERNKPYQIHYLRESRPLGTAGSLKLLPPKLDRTFFVSNCDILVDADYSEILRMHREQGNEITAVAALNVQSVPYGVFECDRTGRLTGLREKPSLSFLVNVGLYVLEPSLRKALPADRPTPITDLLEQVRRRGGRVGVFPITEGAWVDIGEWHAYFKAIHRPSATPAPLPPPSGETSPPAAAD
jgi:dTDP-glucose pyrophosphorylase